VPQGTARQGTGDALQSAGADSFGQGSGANGDDLLGRAILDRLSECPARRNSVTEVKEQRSKARVTEA